MVVALDPIEMIGRRSLAFAELEPLLEGDDARARIAQVDLALEAVEPFHPLDRVALDGRPQGLAHRPQQVDERRRTQQVVDLVLARPVAAHQALERGGLVRGVVVDVHRRVGSAALGEEVHDGLEAAPLAVERELAGRIARPEGVERAVHLEDAEEVVEAILERVRVALDVEEQVARRGRRKDGESPFRVDRVARREEQVVVEPAVPSALELDPGLFMDAFERTGARPLEPRVHRQRQLAERLERGDARSISARRCRAEIPATRLRWSSDRRRAAHSAAQRQTSQCSTGSGYVAAGGYVGALSAVIVARNRAFALR